MRAGGGGVRAGSSFAARGGGVSRGSYAVRGYGGAYRGGAYYRGGVAGPRYYGGRYWNVAPIRYYRPYYAFSPRFSLGFGLWAGYPVTWGYPYYYPYYDYSYAYPSPYPYPYDDQYPAGTTPGYNVAPPVSVSPNSNGAPPAVSGQPDQSNLGGMSFEITPSDAQIFIDGNYAGTVGQFTPTSQPLGVGAGRHRVEIRGSGYKTMSFDVDIVAGQVIPYQGQMER